jgi:DNA-binding transcriptional LysR family regulator
MELRHLRYFVAIAEERGFNRAADRLHIAQPSLSQQMKALEREIGAPLFERARGSRGVTLTSAGALLLREARGIVGHVERSVNLVIRQVRDRMAVIRLGIPPEVPMAFIDRVVDILRSALPQIDLEPVAATSPEQLQSLDDGALDLGLVHLPCHDHVIRLLPVLDQQYGLWLPTGHPLLAGRAVRPAQLDGRRVSVSARSAAPDSFDQMTHDLRAAGASPTWVEVLPDGPAATVRIRLLGLPYLGAHDVDRPLSGFRWRRLAGDPACRTTALAWRADLLPGVADCVTALADRAAASRRRAF